MIRCWSQGQFSQDFTLLDIIRRVESHKIPLLSQHISACVSITEKLDMTHRQWVYYWNHCTFNYVCLGRFQRKREPWRKTVRQSNYFIHLVIILWWLICYWRPFSTWSVIFLTSQGFCFKIAAEMKVISRLITGGIVAFCTRESHSPPSSIRQK